MASTASETTSNADSVSGSGSGSMDSSMDESEEDETTTSDEESSDEESSSFLTSEGTSEATAVPAEHEEKEAPPGFDPLAQLNLLAADKADQGPPRHDDLLNPPDSPAEPDELPPNTRQRAASFINTNVDSEFGCCGWVLTILSYLLIVFTFPFSLCLCIKVVQEYERAVIFRLGRLLPGGAKGPGIFFIVPCIDTYRKVDLRVVSFDVPPQEILSKDSVTVAVDAVVYFRISNATISVTNVEDAARSTKLLAQTTLRNILGTKTLAEMLSDREAISHQMQSTLDEATDPWGVKVERVEVKDVRLPVQLQRAMAAEAEAAREARAKVIAAEGEQKASRALKEAADVISESPSALQLRYLQTLNSISAEKNSTIIFPLPIDMLSGFLPMPPKVEEPPPPPLPKRIRPCCLYKYPEWVQQVAGQGEGYPLYDDQGGLPPTTTTTTGQPPLRPQGQFLPQTQQDLPQRQAYGAGRPQYQSPPQQRQALLRQAVANRMQQASFRQDGVPRPLSRTNAIDTQVEKESKKSASVKRSKKGSKAASRSPSVSSAESQNSQQSERQQVPPQTGSIMSSESSMGGGQFHATAQIHHSGAIGKTTLAPEGETKLPESDKESVKSGKKPASVKGEKKDETGDAKKDEEDRKSEHSQSSEKSKKSFTDKVKGIFGRKGSKSSDKSDDDDKKDDSAEKTGQDPETQAPQTDQPPAGTGDSSGAATEGQETQDGSNESQGNSGYSNEKEGETGESIKKEDKKPAEGTATPAGSDKQPSTEETQWDEFVKSVGDVVRASIEDKLAEGVKSGPSSAKSSKHSLEGREGKRHKRSKHSLPREEPEEDSKNNKNARESFFSSFFSSGKNETSSEPTLAEAKDRNDDRFDRSEPNMARRSTKHHSSRGSSSRSSERSEVATELAKLLSGEDLTQSFESVQSQPEHKRRRRRKARSRGSLDSNIPDVVDTAASSRSSVNQPRMGYMMRLHDSGDDISVTGSEGRTRSRHSRHSSSRHSSTGSRIDDETKELLLQQLLIERALDARLSKPSSPASSQHLREILERRSAGSGGSGSGSSRESMSASKGSGKEAGFWSMVQPQPEVPQRPSSLELARALERELSTKQAPVTRRQMAPLPPSEIRVSSSGSGGTGSPFYELSSLEGSSSRESVVSGVSIRYDKVNPLFDNGSRATSAASSRSRLLD